MTDEGDEIQVLSHLTMNTPINDLLMRGNEINQSINKAQNALIFLDL